MQKHDFDVILGKFVTEKVSSIYFYPKENMFGVLLTDKGAYRLTYAQFEFLINVAYCEHDFSLYGEILCTRIKFQGGVNKPFMQKMVKKWRKIIPNIVQVNKPTFGLTLVQTFWIFGLFDKHYNFYLRYENLADFYPNKYYLERLPNRNVIVKHVRKRLVVEM